jgi:histidinol dehydrogenase
MLKTIYYNGKINDVIEKLNMRKEYISKDVNETVSEILADVKASGDEALKKYSKNFDRFDSENMNDFIVSEKEIEDALESMNPSFIKILERTKNQVTEFHKNQIEKSWSLYKENGVIMGQIVRPIERVALYVPGGTAVYPSTVMMNAIPAKLAGVKDLFITTPVKEDGKVSPVILTAARICGINTIYKVGGAQAIGAVAYGTSTIKKADKVIGPGNIYVSTAKKLCYGLLDIDMIAGPSEVLVIADKFANPKYIAADLLSQVEHDVLSGVILVTTDEELVNKVNCEIEKQIAYLKRADIIKQSLANNGIAIIVDNEEQAFEVSNEIAPEHLEVLIREPCRSLPQIKNAGSIFLGEYTPEPLGDYMSGTNHVLPTGGTAKFYSALGVYDFIKYSSYSYYPKQVLETFKDDVIEFANAEGFDAHANSISVRFKEE